ncbi:MAG: flavodoxin domain-containing protein [Actinomycetaceae bacterium]|nr:flavodoxin domain-containing protein [Actinomycetaceae bacterium]MDU0970169.1 flavodoxin domain-containing protein [Actinomycetaceae bacterium]
MTVASKHGSAHEVGHIIADELRAQGLDVDEVEPHDVHSLADYDGVVLGSAVYMAQWMDEAKEFVSRFGSTIEEVPLWAFSVGMSGVKSGNVNDPSRVGPVLLTLSPREHKTFKGKLDPQQLSWRERTIAKLGGAVEGDYRDETEERAWAREIANELAQSH